MMKREKANFQNYCWPILGDNDTTLIYKYELRCLDYDTVWNRYYKIEAYSENGQRFFDYSVFQTNTGLESQYTYRVDSLGIQIANFSTLDSRHKKVKGLVHEERSFDWDLNQSDIHKVQIEFDDSDPNVEEREVNTTMRYMGNGGKVRFNKEKYESIRFERSVERIKGDSSNTAYGISYYAKGLGYYGAYIIYNEDLEFEERLIEIIPVTDWVKEEPIATSE